MLNVVSWVYLSVFFAVAGFILYMRQSLDTKGFSLSVVVFSFLRMLYHGMSIEGTSQKLHQRKLFLYHIEAIIIYALMSAIGMICMMQQGVLLSINKESGILSYLLVGLMLCLILVSSFRLFRYIYTLCKSQSSQHEKASE